MSLHNINLNIHYTMPEAVWESWYSELKDKLTAALGYEIGEPEDGYAFVIGTGQAEGL